jgi:hypothetical protein
MEKTLVRFFGGAVMVWGALVGLPTSAHAQSIAIDPISQNGPARQPLAQVIRVTNQGGPDATGVTVTFTVPKGAKVDSSCQFDRFHGVGSYTCTVGTGTLGAGQTVDIPFTISMGKSAEVSVEVTCDQGTFVGSILITIL